jgi:hypothetical protein
MAGLPRHSVARNDGEDWIATTLCVSRLQAGCHCEKAKLQKQLCCVYHYEHREAVDANAFLIFWVAASLRDSQRRSSKLQF